MWAGVRRAIAVTSSREKIARELVAPTLYPIVQVAGHEWGLEGKKKGNAGYSVVTGKPFTPYNPYYIIIF